MARSAAVQMLLDRAKIRDLQVTNAHAVDQRDWDLLRTVFAKDGVYRYEGKDLNREEAVKYISSEVSRYHTTFHFVGNQFIDVNGDQATSKTLTMQTLHADFHGHEVEHNVIRTRYFDKLRREGDGWVIYERGAVQTPASYRRGDSAVPDWRHTGLANVTSDDPAVQVLLGRAELYDLAIRYGIAIDTRDMDHMRACFAPKMAARYGAGMEFTEIEKLTEWIMATRSHPFTLHMMSNQMVDMQGDGARMETYAKITHSHPDPLTGAEHRDAGGAGKYTDRLERINGHWKIAERGLGANSGPIVGRVVASSKDPEVQYLIDRLQISDVIVAYTFGIDRRDYDLVRGCFAPNIRYKDGDKEVNGLDAFMAYIKPHMEQVKSTNHFVGNQRINLRGDRAEVETYYFLTHRDGFGDSSPWSRGARKFKDRLVKQGDRWLIEEREIVTNRLPAVKVLKG